MEVLWRLAYLLALLSVGVGARYVGLLNEHRVDYLTAIAFYVALPALVFSSTYDRSLADLVSPALVVGTVLVFGLTAAVAWLVHRRPPRTRRAVAFVQSYHSNLGFLGLPFVAVTLGPDATAVASVILGVGVLTQTPMTIAALIAITDADASVTNELRRVLTNPVLVALAAGIVASAVGLDLPAAADVALAPASEIALPIALVAVGAALQPRSAEFDVGETGTVVAMKVACMPAIAWLVFSLLSVGPAGFAAGVVMLGAPSAVSTFVYANELSGDARFASVNVFTSTVVSIGTMFLLVTLVR